MSVKKEHYIWAEKYRPQCFEEFVGSDTIQKTFQEFIEKKDIPHLLLYGNAGVGKTSIAKILATQLPCDYKYINASDERTIDTVRDKIVTFASTVSFEPLRIVILDEADYLPALSLAALRNVMESRSEHCKFILTCNYIERIISPIISRCATFEIKPPSKETVAEHLAGILESEKVEYDIKDIVFIVRSYYPDIRKIINFSQQSTLNNKLIIADENVVGSDYKEKLIELLKSPSKPKVFTEIRQLVADAAFSNYDEVYAYLYEKVDTYAEGKEALVILELADAVYQSSLVFEKEITFVAMMQKILEVLKK